MRDITKPEKLQRIPFLHKHFKKKNNVKLVFGLSGLCGTKPQSIEGIYINKIRRKIKKNIKKTKRLVRAKNSMFSYWLRYNPNTYLTKKAKNARMGSGNGKFVRRFFRLPANQSFLEFKKIKTKISFMFNKYLWIKFNLKLKLKTPLLNSWSLK